MKKIYKSGTNKGNRRVWIEGKVLLDMGWTRGTRLHRRVVPDIVSAGRDSLVLARLDGIDLSGIGLMRGQHRVAGTDKRPIIDLNGAYLNDLFGSRTHFLAYFHPNGESIVIHPCDEAGQ